VTAIKRNALNSKIKDFHLVKAKSNKWSSRIM